MWHVHSCTYSGTEFRHAKGWNPDTCYHTQEPHAICDEPQIHLEQDLYIILKWTPTERQTIRLSDISQTPKDTHCRTPLELDRQGGGGEGGGQRWCHVHCRMFVSSILNLIQELTGATSLPLHQLGKWSVFPDLSFSLLWGFSCGTVATLSTFCQMFWGAKLSSTPWITSNLGKCSAGDEMRLCSEASGQTRFMSHCMRSARKTRGLDVRSFCVAPSPRVRFWSLSLNNLSSCWICSLSDSRREGRKNAS